jgi:hypothetical protein
MAEGALGHLRFARETTGGTAVAAKHSIPFLPGESLAQTKDVFINDTVRGNWDHAQAREGVNDIGGSVAVELDPLLAPYFLVGVFGEEPTTKNIDTFTLLDAETAAASMTATYDPPVSSRIIVTVAAGTAGSGTVKITGTDSAGSAADETLTFAANGTQVTTDVFKTITAIDTTGLADEVAKATITLKSFRTVVERADAAETITILNSPGVASKLRITASEGTDNTGTVAVTGTDKHGTAQNENVTMAPVALLAATAAEASMALTTQPTVATRLEVILAAGTDGTGTITFAGTDEYGNTIAETLVFADNGTKTTGQHFLTVTGITTTGLADEGEPPTVAVNAVTKYTTNVYGSVTALTSTNLHDEVAKPKVEIDAYAYYEHTFVPADARWSSTFDVPPFTLEVWRDDEDASPKAQQYTGCSVSSASLEFSVSDQIPKLTCNFIGKGCTQITKTTPSYLTSPLAWTAWEAALTLGGSATSDIEAVNLSLDNKLAARHTLSGSRDATKVLRTDKRDVNLDLTFLWDDDDQYENFQNQSQTAMTCTFTSDTAIACAHKYTMVVTVPAYKYTAFAPNVGSMGPITVEAKGIGDNDLTTGYTVQVVLTNTYPNYTT